MSKFVDFKGNEIYSKKGQLLGFVEYYPQWKKHVFEPYSNTIFDTICLTDIAEELKRRDNEWKQTKE
jgi:hypothetical protein